ncbi:MAG: hypothetical protein KDK65_04590, partial [Chlamydiia bacterium]|nr:hypothetical protein [Chlamydiia bacterium]
MTHQLLPTLPHTHSLVEQIERKIDQLITPNAKKELPIIQTNLNAKQPYSLSIAIICMQDHASSISDFLNHVIRLNLIPGREFTPISTQHYPFSRQTLSSKPLLFAHYEFLIGDNHDLDLIHVYLPFLKQTLHLGLMHPNYAKNLGKTELLFPEQRNQRIHHYLANVVQRYPKTNDILFPAVGTLMTAASEMFFRHRTPKDLSRIFASMTWMKHLIIDKRAHPEDNIEICTRFLSINLNYTFGSDLVLGVVVAVSHLDEYQLLNERCIMQSILRYIPDAIAVNGSYIHVHQSHEAPHLYYIEIKRKQAKRVNLNERSLLKENLSQSIKASIEDVIPAAFVMNNEEEIMKNILTLRQELISIEDPPQVIISFENHTTSHITFSVTLVRILEQDHVSLNEAFRELSEEWEYLPERKRIVSQEHDDFTKEAHVFHLRYRKSLTSNSDENSLNLHRSRQAVVNLLTEHLGPIRDYTGGVIVQQNAIFEQLKTRYSPLIQSHPGLIESFFYQLHPTDMVVVLPFEEIAQFFESITQVIDTSTQETNGYTVYQKESEQMLKTVVRIPNNMKEFLQKRLSQLEIDHVQILTTLFHHRGVTFFGVMAHAKMSQRRFLIQEKIQELLRACIHEEQNSQVLNICTYVIPPSLDPRISLHDANSLIF